MSADGLEALRAIVHADPALAAELAAMPVEDLEAELLHRAAELGLEVTRADLERCTSEAARDWTTRWLR